MKLHELEHFDPRQATLDQVLTTRARTTGEQVFLTHLPDGKRFTYADIDDLTRRIGNGLQEAGIERGTHVAVLMDNCSEQLLAIFGVVRSGRVAVPINSAAKGQLLAYLLSHADCRALIVEEALLPRLVEIIDQVPLLATLFVARVATRIIDSPQDVERARRVDPSPGLPRVAERPGTARRGNACCSIQRCRVDDVHVGHNRPLEGDHVQSGPVHLLGRRRRRAS